MAGFLKRQCRDLNVFAVVQLYNALVRPILEYCCVIWCPVYSTHIYRLESVQRRIVNFILFKCHIDRHSYDYTERLSLVGLQSLETRRKIYLVKYGHRILKGTINCPELNSLINLRTPAYATRLNEHYVIPRHRTNYGLHNPVSLILRSINEVSNACSFEDCSLTELNRVLLRLWPV